MLLFCLEYILFEGGCGYNESGKTKERGFVRTLRVKVSKIAEQIGFVRTSRVEIPKIAKQMGFARTLRKEIPKIAEQLN